MGRVGDWSDDEPGVADVSAVIVAHGRRDLVVRLLGSLRSGSMVPREIIVVDNDSPDDTAAVIRRDHPDVILVEAGVNLGYGAGVNLGVRRARQPVVAVLNSDVVVEPGWLSPLSAALAVPGVRISAPRYVGTSGETVECGASIDGDGLVRIDTECPEPAGHPWPDGVHPVDHASAACWVFRRSWFERVGGFDPVFGLGYFEDVDLGSWVKARGGFLVVASDAAVRHDTGGSFSSTQAERLARRNQRIWAARWGRWRGPRALPVMVTSGTRCPDGGGVW